MTTRAQAGHTHRALPTTTTAKAGTIGLRSRTRAFPHPFRPSEYDGRLPVTRLPRIYAGTLHRHDACHAWASRKHVVAAGGANARAR